MEHGAWRKKQKYCLLFTDYQDYLLINLIYGTIFNVKVRDVIKMIEEDGCI